MAVKIQLRRDTAANWNSNNPILAEGEIGIELDTNRMKVGDGSTHWNDLSYAFEDYYVKIGETVANADNADKVDNFDASQTPQANTIPVAGSNGKLDEGWLPDTGGNWEQNFSSNGYTKLPNGLIIQWGYGVYDSSGGYATVTFPIQFPNECFSVSLTPRRNLSGSQIYTVELVDNPDRSSFNLALYSETSGSFALDGGVVFWIAVGH